MRVTFHRMILGFLLCCPGMGLLGSCGGDTDRGASSASGAGRLVLYAGRKGSVVEPIVEKFKSATGIDVTIVQDKSGANLLSKIDAEEEAGKSVADVLWVTDPAALGAASAGGLLAALPRGILERAPEAWQASTGTWVGTSGRTRVLAYNPNLVQAEDLPRTLEDLLDPKWKGKIGWAPTNGSFQAFLSAMRGLWGDDARVEAWLRGMMANEPKAYPKNTPIVRALASGEIALGLTNHYYITRAQVKDPQIPVRVARFADGDVGNLVMVAGAGVLQSSQNRPAAERFVRFLLEEDAQSYFTQTYCEYPVVTSVATNDRLVSLAELLKKAPAVDLSTLRDHAATVELLKTVGLQ